MPQPHSAASHQAFHWGPQWLTQQELRQESPLRQSIEVSLLRHKAGQG